MYIKNTGCCMDMRAETVRDLEGNMQELSERTYNE